MTQEAIPERDPATEWWEIYGHTRKVYGKSVYEMMQDSRDLRNAADPWINGRYALAALVWGLIFMLVLSVKP